MHNINFMLRLPELKLGYAEQTKCLTFLRSFIDKQIKSYWTKRNADDEIFGVSCIEQNGGVR